jgi:hypothetical protein
MLWYEVGCEGVRLFVLAVFVKRDTAKSDLEYEKMALSSEAEKHGENAFSFTLIRKASFRKYIYFGGSRATIQKFLRAGRHCNHDDAGSRNDALLQPIQKTQTTHC